LVANLIKKSEKQLDFLFFYYLCSVKGLKTILYTKSSKLPVVDEENFFHSRELFEIAEQTPRQRPVMAITTDEEGRIVCHMLGIIRLRTFLFPPLFFIHFRVLGEGIYYNDSYKKEELFDEMLAKMKARMSHRTLFMEMSNMSQKMFGYKQLRQQGFFPVNWSSVHNSLHSHAPEERISAKMQKRIDTSHNKGVKTEIVTTEEDFKAFSKLLREHNFLKPKRYIPDNIFFRKLMEGQHGQLFVTKYHNKVIACAACVYSMGNAYLWYTAFRRKTYRHLHPDIIIVWDVMKDAYQKGYAHMCFMDVGLPFSKNPFREFILRFGGKEQSTYRWFRFSIRWVNALLSWLYRE